MYLEALLYLGTPCIKDFKKSLDSRYSFSFKEICGIKSKNFFPIVCCKRYLILMQIENYYAADKVYLPILIS